MNLADVSQLSQTELFLYWIQERHAIYLRRERGQLPPWTDDEILQNYFFTNPYREHDKTTVWFREKVRDPLAHLDAVIMATVIFRWFNYIPTGEHLEENCWLTSWDHDEVLHYFQKQREMGVQIFTGAYMINSPAGVPKLEAICRRIDNVWQDRKSLQIRAKYWKTLEGAHADFTRYEGLGGFMAYEIVTDLRHTKWLEKATDKMEWSNPGPGAIRGLYRILGMDIPNKSNSTSPPCPDDYQQQTARLLALVNNRLSQVSIVVPMFEMRDVEHSLCEFDKYSRLLRAEGRSRRKFEGV
jgi:hypothetical protein